MPDYTLTQEQALEVFFALRHSHPASYTAEATARHDRALLTMRHLTYRIRMGLLKTEPSTLYDIGNARSQPRG